MDDKQKRLSDISNTALVVNLSGAYTQITRKERCAMWYLQNVNVGWVIVHWLIMFVFWGSIGLLIVTLMRVGEGQAQRGIDRAALDVSKKHYASGEIRNEHVGDLERG